MHSSRLDRRSASLGPLEVAVMDRLWEQEGAELDVAAVHAEVGRPRGVSRSTIHTTLERLVRKGLVGRRREGRAYRYAASGARRDWIALVFDELVAGLGEAPGLEVLAGFVDFAERTRPETLATLEALVGERRRARDEAASERGDGESGVTSAEEADEGRGHA
jgi:predicted transcriptional regulator